MNNAVVLAIGNLLLADDGAGAKVLAALYRHASLPGRPRLLEGGTLSFSLAPELEDCDALIVVDASRMGAAPGTVRCFEAAAMDRQLNRSGRSVHEVGLADVLDMLRLTDRLPARRALIGIEPATIDWGEDLTPPVAAAVPAAAEQIIDLLHRWQTEALRSEPAPATQAPGAIVA